MWIEAPPLPPDTSFTGGRRARGATDGRGNTQSIVLGRVLRISTLMGPSHECTTNQSGRLMKLRGYGSRRFMFSTGCLVGWQDLKTTYNPAAPQHIPSPAVRESSTHYRIVNPPSFSPYTPGFEIMPIDEHLTSSCCPLCKATIPPFKTRDSPRPWQANGHGRIKP
jgi:hypothetical protein